MDNVKTVETKPITVKLPLDLDHQIETLSDAQGISKMEWMRIAAREKLARPEDMTAAFPMLGLSGRDKERVEKLISFLRVAPEGLKEASDMSLQILKKAMAEIESEVKRRGKRKK